MLEQDGGKFSLARGEKDGLPYFLGVRENFSKFQHKDQYPWLLSFEIYFQPNDRFGLTSDDEAAILNEFEDFLGAQLSEAAKIFFVARTTWNSVRSIFYYVSDPKSISEKLEEIMKKKLYPKEFQYEIVKDPEWKKMADIVPNIENF